MSDLTLTDQEKGGVLVSLGEDGSTELAVVGGKGASLGRLVKAGFPVPSGFIVTTDAYASCLRANDLEVKIEKILGELDYGNLDELEEETARIREAVDAYNSDLDTSIFHGERFRMQWPFQKCFYNPDISKEIEAIVKEAATA